MPNTKNFSSGEKLEYIDVLRAIAILMIILIHTNQTVQGVVQSVKFVSAYGQMGVQLFFVASAYTLCFSQIRREQEKKHLLSFFIRRFFRIAPLYYLAIAGYFFTDSFAHILRTIQSSYSQYNLNSILANIFFVHGFIMSANNNVVPGGWSIGAEMAFYGLFPILFALFIWIYQRWGMIALYGLVGCSIGLDILGQFILWKWLAIDIVTNSFVYWNLINQLPAFLLGMIVFFYHYYNLEWKLSVINQTVLFIVLTVIMIFVSEERLLWSLTIAPLGSGLTFVLLLNILKELKYSNTFLEKIGQVSYSMYICHFIFVWYLVPGIMLNFNKFVDPHIILISSFLLVTVFSFLVAQIIYKYIESPGIKLGKRLIAKLQKIPI
jgi:peptidoglycan/LPS O-acetylase OafA/YrhL